MFLYSTYVSSIKQMNLSYLQLDERDLAAAPQCFAVAGREIGVFRVGGEVYAIDNLCPHAHASLHEGHLQGEIVECAFHNARFHLPSGRCLRGPGQDIRTYPVERDGHMLRIAVEPRDVPDGLGLSAQKNRQLQREESKQ
jgi:3-phenylpropionate/trans-cinnamate dioxygenase ferredoxin component